MESSHTSSWSDLRLTKTDFLCKSNQMMAVHVLYVLYKHSERTCRYITAFDLSGEGISKVATTRTCHFMQMFE